MEPEAPDEGMEELAARVLRPPRRISDEDLVASELASAVLSDPLGKIRHAVEAMYLLDGEERRAAGITGEEEELAGRIHSLAITLQNACVRNFQEVKEEGVKIPWPFPREEAGTWLPWVGEDLPIHFFREKEGSAGEDLSRLPHPERVYTATGRYWVPRYVLHLLTTRFVRYAMPHAARLMKKVMRLVSPDSYREALQLLRGGRRGRAKD